MTPRIIELEAVGGPRDGELLPFVWDADFLVASWDDEEYRYVPRIRGTPGRLLLVYDGKVDAGEGRE